MSKKSSIALPIRRFEEEEPRAYTDRLGFYADRLDEQSSNCDLSFEREESYSITNLRQDWDSIKALQDDIKKTSEKLKQFGSVHARPLSECGKPLKSEKKGKIDNTQSREFKKLRDKCRNLSITLSKCEKENNELININAQLRQDLRQAMDLNSELKNRLQSTTRPAPIKKTAEILKYGQFFIKKLKDLQKWEELFAERVLSSSSYISLIKSQKFDDCLLSTLQFLSDLAVHYLRPKTDLIPFSFADDAEKSYGNDDSENLLITINAQSERIAKLNKQISEAMISSKELLYSPLAAVLKKETQVFKPSSYIQATGKRLFVTPEKWNGGREAIEEINADEEISGKPLDNM